MTTIPSTTTAAATAGSKSLSDLYGSAVKSLTARSTGLQGIDAQLRRDDARLSTLGRLANVLDDVKSVAGTVAASGLKLATQVDGKAVDARITAAGAAAGTHKVDVKQLAQGQQLSTVTVPSATTAIGSGTPTVVKIQTGSDTKTLRIGAPDNTLEGIAAAFKAAGIDAKLVTGDKGVALSLSGRPGAANAMRVQVSGDPALQALLAWQPPARGTVTQTSAAQDAVVNVDGKAVTSAGNRLTGAIAGVTLDLKATGTGTVTIAGDNDAIARNVKAFAAAVNGLPARLAGLKSGDVASDRLLAQIQDQVARLVGGADAAALAAIGVGTKNGKLTVDETKLNAAIAAAPDRVAKVFADGGTGLADRLGAGLAQQLATGSTLANQATAVTKDRDALADKKTQMTQAVNAQASSLVQQYANAGANSLFGMMSQGRPASAFDFLA
ncbi:flagellar filament capping protein FliD [Massilia luteola]|uniref:flagellar filament capping protein FliD n=1 Tax=Massilia luteola TaxID=3081751 RepID=UPI002ACC319C|nr:flagellar filament capping protein FliD [Massilia sp. Gc5]